MLEDEVKRSLVIAIQRLDMVFSDIDTCINDIATEFNYLKLKDIIEAIRNGGLGKYGRTYKLNTQEVCIWVREYLKEKNPRLGI